MDTMLTDNAISILNKRYLARDSNGNIIESPSQMFRRVAHVVAQAENIEDRDTWEDIFYGMMAELRFLPNSPCLMNAGRASGMLSACFALPIEDSLDSIFTTLHDAMLIQGAGGGCGYSFSNLRPKGDIVNSTGHPTSGPISFLKVYNAAMEVVKQGGARNGANMATLNCNHPDIEEFIDCKRNDKSITNFNLSVCITNEFINAVKCDGTFNLKNPRTGKVTKTVNAKQLWNKIAEGAWKNGEPGIIMIDEVNANNPIPTIPIRTTNPCVIGNTLIQTDRGLERMKTFVTEQRPNALVMGKNGQWRKVISFMDNGIKPVWKITTQSGYNFTATGYHKIPLTDGRLIPVKELNLGDEIYLQPNEGKFGTGIPDPKVAELFGWLVGDGFLNNTNIRRRSGLIINKQDSNLVPYLRSLVKKITGIELKEYRRINKIHLVDHSNKLWKWAVKEMGIYSIKAGNKQVPETMFTANKNSILAFLRGLFSANGHVKFSKWHGGGKSISIVLSSKSVQLIQGVQILLQMFGVRSSLLNRSRPARTGLFTVVESLHCINRVGEAKEYNSDGKLYEIHLHGEARKLFLQKIGFTKGSYKNQKLQNVPINSNEPCKSCGLKDKVVDIAFAGEESVYDIMIDDPDGDLSMVNNGLITWDCGELPLPDYGSCNLGSINLNTLLINSGNGYNIDYNALRTLTNHAVRFLDDVITVNKYPLPKVTETTLSTRRIGLGIMGLADVLLLMHKKYDSIEGRKVAHDIMQVMNDEAHLASRQLAALRGPFPLCADSIYAKDPHRNATLTTIAPTGTISTIANCSSGCEPHFLMVYERRILNNTKMIEVNPAFIRLATEEGFWSDKLVQQIMDNGGKVRGIPAIPEWVQDLVKTATDIKAIDHVEMQAILQLHVDNSISKTINAAEKTTIQEIADIFMAAHDKKCRGLAFYREGSRSEIVLSRPTTTSTSENNHMRAKVLQGRTHKIRSGYGSLYVTVNRNPGNEIEEVFITTNDVGGEIRCWTEFASRIASYALRLGLPIATLIKSGKKIRGPKPIIDQGQVIASGPDAVAKVLEIEAGQTVEISTSTDTICPECHGDMMVKEEGCSKCYSCGYTKCGG